MFRITLNELLKRCKTEVGKTDIGKNTQIKKEKENNKIKKQKAV